MTNTVWTLFEEWSWSLSLRLVYPVLHKPPGATITSRSAVRIRINFWRMVGLYISFGDWANALECWRSPSLRLVIPGIAVPPGVTHSDSHHRWYEHCRKTSPTTNTVWIFCSPEPSFSWRRPPPKHTLPAGRYSFGNANMELTIKDIVPNDEGDYVCTASNMQGSSSQTLQISVQGERY